MRPGIAEVAVFWMRLSIMGLPKKEAEIPAFFNALVVSLSRGKTCLASDFMVCFSIQECFINRSLLAVGKK